MTDSQQRAERQRYVALVADELRGPLTAIAGSSRTMRNSWEQVDDATKLELLDNIERQAARLTHRIDQLLVLAGLRAADSAVAARPFAIDAVVREAVEGLGEQLAARVVTADVQPLAVVAARDMGVMVVRILVEQAAECVAGEITVQARPVDGKVAVCIRGHEAPPGGGTAAEVGLSAYIARDLIESMGGRLDVDLDGGAPVFTAVLPAR